MIAVATSIGLIAAVAAGAQTSVTTTTTTSPSTTGSITIAPEKRTVIRERLGTMKPAPVKEKITVGTTAPDTLELNTVPDAAVSDIPAVKGYSYFVYNDGVVMVDPKTRKVVTIVE